MNEVWTSEDDGCLACMHVVQALKPLTNFDSFRSLANPAEAANTS